MKRVLSVITVVFILAVVTSCSKDGVTLAKYQFGKKDYALTIGDVKAELLPYVSYNAGITNDIGWHSNYITEKVAYEIVSMDQLSKGITNQESFKIAFDAQYKKQYLLTLYQKTQATLSKKVKGDAYDVARVSHILLLINKQTNINGKSVTLSEAAINKQVQEKENAALNIIETLKAAKNIESEFSNTATKLSEDGGSKIKGGDVGFFTRGMMVKEFEEAAFTATKKGLIEKPVRTDYGIHIVYVKVPYQKLKMGNIERLAGKENYRYIEPYFQNAFIDNIKTKNLTESYKVDLAKGWIEVNGKQVKVANLADNDKLFDIFGVPYTWKTSKEVIQLFIPNFTSNMTITNFEEQMVNLKNFIPFIEFGKKEGIEKSSDFVKETSKFKEQLIKRLTVQLFWDNMKDQASGLTTQANIRAYYNALSNPTNFNSFLDKTLGIKIPEQYFSSYYDSIKSSFSKNVSGKMVLMGFKEAEARIKSEIERGFVQTRFENWKEEALKTYHVAYNKSGINALIRLEVDQIQDAQKKREKDMKKFRPKNPQPQQPQTQQPQPEQKK